MPPAIIAAGIGAAAGIGGAVIGGKSQSNAAKTAANTAETTNANNIAFQTGIYNQNQAHFAPWEQSGLAANNAIMQLLNLSGPAQAAPQVQPAFAAYGGQNYLDQAVPNAFGANVYDGGAHAARTYYDGAPDQSYSNTQYGQPYDPGAVTAPAPSVASAFDNYRNSTGYQFRVDQGTNALQKAFGRNLDSGAADKAAIRFGQGTASDEFSRYMSLLNQQQQLGFGSASALAGVGQNFGNTVAAGNTAAGNAAANAQLYAGSANANMWKGIGSSFGQLAGSIGSLGRGSGVTGTTTGDFNGIPLQTFKF